MIYKLYTISLWWKAVSILWHDLFIYAFVNSTRNIFLLWQNLSRNPSLGVNCHTIDSIKVSNSFRDVTRNSRFGLDSKFFPSHRYAERNVAVMLIAGERFYFVAAKAQVGASMTKCEYSLNIVIGEGGGGRKIERGDNIRSDTKQNEWESHTYGALLIKCKHMLMWRRVSSAGSNQFIIQISSFFSRFIYLFSFFFSFFFSLPFVSIISFLSFDF